MARAARKLSPIRVDARVALNAIAHDDAHRVNGRRVSAKKVAAANGVTDRTARRWRDPEDAKGSLQDRYSIYLTSAQHPARLVARNDVEAFQQTVQEWPKDRLIAEYRAALIRDKQNEARDTTNSFAQERSWLERAADSERDAEDDVLKAACEIEFHARGIPVSEVLGR